MKLQFKWQKPKHPFFKSSYSKKAPTISAKMLTKAILILSIFVYAGCSVTSKQNNHILSSENGQAAPEFSLSSLDGTMVNLSDYAGKYVVIHIATTWCPFCNAEAPYLEKLYQDYQHKNVEVLIIDVMEPPSLVQSKIKDKFNLSFPILLDKDGEASARFAPKGVLPELERYEVMLASNLIIDPEGKIQFMSLLDSQNFDAKLIHLKQRLEELLRNDKATSSILQVEPEKNTVIRAGEQELLSLSIQLENGYHIQANEVPDPNLIPMQLTLESNAQIIAGEPIFPNWKETKYDESTFWIYENEIDIAIPITAKRALKPGLYVLSGEVFYQACTQVSCLLPRTEYFDIPINVI